MGLHAKKGERKHEDQLKQSRKALHEKVRLYARMDKALISAKERAEDASAAIESVLSWQRFVALNLGPAKMAEACVGMTFARISWVEDWCMRVTNRSVIRRCNRS